MSSIEMNFIPFPKRIRIMQGYYPVSISLNALILIKIYFSLNEGDLNDKLVSSTHKILFKKLIIFVQMNK